MSPAEVKATAGCLRAALRSLIDLAEFYEAELLADEHPELAHPDYPPRIESQVADASLTVGRIAREYRRLLEVGRRGAA